MMSMIRTQISLKEADMERLRTLAHERGVSIASLLRSSVDRLLQDAENVEVRDRALAASGRFRSGAGANAGVEHDEAFIESIVS